MISIIIPIYNSESFLEKCFQSIYLQEYENYEVICVDDGSTDSTPEIIKKQCALDKRFKYIRKQKHTNAGDARNIGMEHASGEYYMFLDSDDYLKDNIFTYLIDEAEKTKADIVVFQYKLFFHDLGCESKKVYGINTNRKKVFKLEELTGNKFEFTNIAVWNKMYRKSFVKKNGLYYKSYPAINDVFFSWCALMRAETIALCRRVGVYYRVNRKQSITDNIARTSKIFLEAFYDVVQYASENGLWEKYGEDMLFAESKQINEFMYRMKRVPNLQGEVELFEKKKNALFEMIRKGIKE